MHVPVEKANPEVDRKACRQKARIKSYPSAARNRIDVDPAISGVVDRAYFNGDPFGNGHHAARDCKSHAKHDSRLVPFHKRSGRLQYRYPTCVLYQYQIVNDS